MTCFNANSLPEPGLLPCIPGIRISPCCASGDLCLSNGLCLDTGSDNGFTTQGCTDQDWGSPCVSNCVQWARDTQTPYYPYLASCMASGSKTTYCCGPDSSCCNNTNVVFSLPRFTDAVRPLASTTSTTSSASSSTASSSGTQTTNTASTTALPSDSNNASGSDSNTSNDDSNNHKTVLGLAIGFGILGLLLILIAGALLFRRWRSGRASDTAELSAAADADKGPVGPIYGPVHGGPTEMPIHYMPAEIMSHRPAEMMT
ncbi:hypothetical protein B0T26DRAFT_528423 [Lasiosphaeria miniovina]|uniref:Mid2 domain-containing protein n=1 Tax=Lasiosphaeria miniovina TaxID=1954250 RepID=A0AA39ZQE8_9PEZI|nr:uncharacterized protein B0T26DRAFT_528423 [Lasiosphaeria miniovina]KAK0701726.1 hypothetical protein B0T26DRAFT_528423 [Lasiosphaeria miniovina]